MPRCRSTIGHALLIAPSNQITRTNPGTIAAIARFMTGIGAYGPSGLQALPAPHQKVIGSFVRLFDRIPDERPKGPDQSQARPLPLVRRRHVAAARLTLCSSQPGPCHVNKHHGTLWFPGLRQVNSSVIPQRRPMPCGQCISDRRTPTAARVMRSLTRQLCSLKSLAASGHNARQSEPSPSLIIPMSVPPGCESRFGGPSQLTGLR
jgi:hypothetical protein